MLPLIPHDGLNEESLDSTREPDYKARAEELLEIAKAVARVGIDFGFGKYELEQKNYRRSSRSNRKT